MPKLSRAQRPQGPYPRSTVVQGLADNILGVSRFPACIVGHREWHQDQEICRSRGCRELDGYDEKRSGDDCQRRRRRIHRRMMSASESPEGRRLIFAATDLGSPAKGIGRLPRDQLPHNFGGYQRGRQRDIQRRHRQRHQGGLRARLLTVQPAHCAAGLGSTEARHCIHAARTPRHNHFAERLAGRTVAALKFHGQHRANMGRALVCRIDSQPQHVSVATFLGWASRQLKCD